MGSATMTMSHRTDVGRYRETDDSDDSEIEEEGVSGVEMDGISGEELVLRQLVELRMGVWNLLRFGLGNWVWDRKDKMAGINGNIIT